MIALPDNAEEVSIRNSQNNSDATFYLRTDRLESFFQYVMANRPTVSNVSGMPGISGAAHYALDCIFFGPKPPRFPASDILAWLRARLGELSVQEIEEGLGHWAATVPQLLADGSERA